MNTAKDQIVWVQLLERSTLPAGLTAFANNATDLHTFHSVDDLPGGTCDLLLLPAPLRIADRRLHHHTLWRKCLQPAHPHILNYGYLPADHATCLDLLVAPHPKPTQLAGYQQPLPSSVEWGQDSVELLRLFLAGHGFNSIRAVLNQLLLTIQIAEREMRDPTTPPEEIRRELFDPVDFPSIWREWEARWINYAPLFTHSPIATRFNRINKKMATFGEWVTTCDPTAPSLTSGKLTEILLSAKDEFTSLERTYLD